VTNWKLTVEYDGSKYRGWQTQINARTVQGEMKKAAEDFFRAEVDIQGSGRTDAGVHALAQVASLRARVKHSPQPGELLAGLNDRLPADIAVLAAEAAGPRFHARHDAVTRTYQYRISTRKNAFAKRYVWWVKEPLDVAAMQHAARSLIGRHDFICFRAPDPSKPAESTIVVVESAAIDLDGDLIVFRIEASHFLWRMVRRIVGALVKLGAGEIGEADFARLLSGKPDKRLDAAAWTAPASGLFLERVSYRR
jgi:tRNA pseudouridine38-40 synthase